MIFTISIMIKAITFDLWNTIFEDTSFSQYRLEFLVNFLKNQNIKFTFSMIKQNFERFFKFLDYNIKDTEYHHIRIEDRIKSLFYTLQIELSNSEKEVVKQNMEKTILKNPPSLKKGVRKTLEELSSFYKLGLISNTGITPGKEILEVFNNYDIAKYFQVTIFSDEIGFYKPNPLLFKIALQELKSRPNLTIHVGDQLHTDIAGAQAVGMKTIWLNDKSKSGLKELKPDYEIKELSEVINIINIENKIY